MTPSSNHPAAAETGKWKYAATAVGLVLLVVTCAVGLGLADFAFDRGAVGEPMAKIASQLLFKSTDLQVSDPATTGAAGRPSKASAGGAKKGKKKGKRKKKKKSKPKSYDLASYKLTRELVDKYAKDNFITVSFGNLYYIGFIENWVRHLQEMGVTNYIVGAMDDEALKGLIDRDINAFSMSHSFPQSDFGWGSKTFYKMARRKIKLIKEFLEMGLDVMVSDVDTVWLQDPNVFFKKHPSLDIMTSTDALRTSSPTGQTLEDADKTREAYNIGILYFRSTAATKEFLNEWVRLIEADKDYWDQNAFNDLLRRDFKLGEGNQYFKAYGDRVSVGILPVSSFCNGHTYFVQSMPQSLGVEPYVVHATFQYSGTEGKRHRFRERMLWYDHPEYYAPDNGVLVYDADLPQELLDGGAFKGLRLELKDTKGHFDLVNHQLKQIRHAMGIAKALNRTLVMPKLFCGNDRWWAPHDGTIPGSAFERPFVCPLDHVIDVNVLVNRKYVDIREYSFLENQRTPREFRDSQALVRVCGPGEGECSGGDPESGPVVSLPPHLDDAQIKNHLASYSQYKVLRFDSMLNAFKGFSAPAEESEFRAVVEGMMGIWCCVRAPTGHIWYDMLWDVVPHVDKHNRKWDAPWEMKLGP
ncbi:arabinosyltransferase [Chloropicon primus]|nr:arabinosyltransferase [Chloropicon primus]